MGKASGSRERPDPETSDVEARVVVTGEIDMATAPALARDLQAAIRDHPARVFVDLRAVDFLDSSGINALVRAHHLAEGFGVALILESPNETCQRVLKVAGLDTLFRIRA